MLTGGGDNDTMGFFRRVQFHRCKKKDISFFFLSSFFRRNRLFSVENGKIIDKMKSFTRRKIVRKERN